MDKLAKVRPGNVHSIEGVLGELARQRRSSEAAAALFDELIPDPYARIFLLDVSGSMADKMGDLKAGAQEGINALPQSAPVSIIEFQTSAETLCRLTTDRRLVRDVIHRLKPSGGTNMVSALTLASQSVEGGRRAVIHVVTDGMPDDPHGTLALARQLVAEGHVIRCTGVTGADQEFLNALAGGEERKVSRVVSKGELRGALSADFALPPPTRALPRRERA